MSEPFDPVAGARKFIARAKEEPDVKRVTVGVAGLVAICQALLDAQPDEGWPEPSPIPYDYSESAE